MEGPGEPYSMFKYSRMGNPTVLELRMNLAALDDAKYALAMNAGTSAISTTMMLLKHEDHMIMVDDVYAGTQKYLRDIYGPRIGWSEGKGYDYCDCTNVDNLKAAFKENTKMVWIEGQTNPTLKVAHIEALA